MGDVEQGISLIKSPQYSRHLQEKEVVLLNANASGGVTQDGECRNHRGGVLITRLKEIGVDHLFGVPGDFILGFFNQVLKSELTYVGTCNELNAAYAADGYPYVTMMLGKTVLSEQHPQFIGLFEGDRSRDYVRHRVESADYILQLGGLMTDFNTGGFTTHLDDARMISANIRSVKIKYHYYEQVYLPDFILGLAEKLTRRDPATLEIQSATGGCAHRYTEPYRPGTPKPLTIKRFFDRMSHYIENKSIVIAETGVSLFSAAEMLMPEGATFIGQTFYGSIGYTVGATLGACMAAQDRPAMLFVGDGAFQVTCQDLSTMIRNHLKPIIFLINNDGYTIERVISDHAYNDIQPWQYHRLVEVFGGGMGLDVRTEGELEDALAKAATADGVVFIEIHTERLDCPEALRSAGRSMAKSNQLDSCDVLCEATIYGGIIMSTMSNDNIDYRRMGTRLLPGLSEPPYGLCQRRDG